MQKKLYFLYVLILSALLIVMPASNWAQNQLSESGFEGTGAGTWIEDNPLDGTGNPSYTFNYDSTDTPHEGSECFRMTVLSPLAWHGGSARQITSVTPGQEFEASTFVRIPTAINARVYIEIVFLDASDNETGKIQSGYLDNLEVPTWTQLSVTTNVPASTVNASVQLVVLPQADITGGEVYFDSVFGGTPEAPPTPETDTSTVFVTLSLDYLSVEIKEDSYNFGLVGLGSETQSGNSLTVTNLGTAATYSLNLISPPSWTASQTAAGDETFVLNAAFNSTSTISWNISNHALSTTAIPCSLTQFAGDQNGMNVPSAEVRNLWLQFLAPITSVIDTQQAIQVIVTAQSP